MSRLNPFSWGDKYRAERNAKIQAEGDAAYSAMYDIPEVQELSEDAARALMRYCSGEVEDPEVVYEAMRQDKVDKHLERRIKQIMKEK